MESYLIAPLLWFTLNIIVATFKADFPHTLRVLLGYGVVPFIICAALFCVSWKVPPAQTQENITREAKEALTEYLAGLVSVENDGKGLTVHHYNAPREYDIQYFKTLLGKLPLGEVEEKNKVLTFLVSSVGYEKNTTKKAQIFEMMDLIIKSGANVNYEYECGGPHLPSFLFTNETKTPLFEAINADSVETVRFLLEHGADVNKTRARTSGPRETPIHFACTKDKKEIANLLLKHGAISDAECNKYAKKEIPSKNGQESLKTNASPKNAAPINNSLMVAIMNGDKQKVAQLIEQGVSVNQADRNAFTPLMIAAIYGHTEIVKQLLEANADVNVSISVPGANGQDLTAIHMARVNNHPEIVDILRAAGARENSDKQGRETLSDNDPYILMLEACSEGNTEMIQTLLKDGVKPTSHHLKIAAQEKQSQVLKQLVESGIDVNLPDDGEYPFLSVVSFCPLEDVELFVKHGADFTVSYPSSSGGSVGPALVLVSLIGDLPKVKYLVEQKADVNITNTSGSTPLIVASSEGHKNIVAYLLEHGANVNATNNHKDTALMVASGKGDLESVKLLFSAGAQINAQNKHKDTALMFAAENGNKEIVQFLISSGADLNLKDTENGTALSLAREKGHTEIIELLKTAGAEE